MTLQVALNHRFTGFSLEVAFEAPAGVTVLFGRSGSGKSSIINCVAGLLRPQAGRVALDGRVLLDSAAGIWLPPYRRRIGYVFQEDRLFPHLSVAGNLTYGRPRGADGADFDRVVDMLGIGGLLSRRPATLSGGEKQRVAIGRALLSDPQLLLMDEPLASLDQARKEEILPYLERLRDETGIPLLYVSHSASEVARLATTVAAISEGRLVRIGPPAEIFADPGQAPLLGRQEAGAVLSAVVTRHDAADGLTELAAGGGRLVLPLIDAPPGTRLRIRVAAQDVMIARTAPDDISALNILPAKITRINETGESEAAVGLDIDGEHLVAWITRRSVRRLELAPGTPCYAIIKSTAVAGEDVGRQPQAR